MVQSHGNNAEPRVGVDDGAYEDVILLDDTGLHPKDLADRLQHGLAQDLVHLRFELEYLARNPDADTTAELRRLEALTGDILEELSELIHDLGGARSPAASRSQASAETRR